MQCYILHDANHFCPRNITLKAWQMNVQLIESWIERLKKDSLSKLIIIFKNFKQEK